MEEDFTMEFMEVDAVGVKDYELEEVGENCGEGTEKHYENRHHKERDRASGDIRDSWDRRRRTDHRERRQHSSYRDSQQKRAMDRTDDFSKEKQDRSAAPKRQTSPVVQHEYRDWYDYFKKADLQKEFKEGSSPTNSIGMVDFPAFLSRTALHQLMNPYNENVLHLRIGSEAQGHAVVIFKTKDGAVKFMEDKKGVLKYQGETIRLYYIQATVKKVPPVKKQNRMEWTSNVPSTNIVLMYLPRSMDADQLYNEFNKNGIELEFCNILQLGKKRGFIGFSTQTEATNWLKNSKGFMLVNGESVFASYCTTNYRKDWHCDKCTFVNLKTRNSCYNCGSSHPNLSLMLDLDSGSTSGTQQNMEEEEVDIDFEEDEFEEVDAEKDVGKHAEDDTHKDRDRASADSRYSHDRRNDVRKKGGRNSYRDKQQKRDKDSRNDSSEEKPNRSAPTKRQTSPVVRKKYKDWNEYFEKVDLQEDFKEVFKDVSSQASVIGMIDIPCTLTRCSLKRLIYPHIQNVLHIFYGQKKGEGRVVITFATEDHAVEFVEDKKGVLKDNFGNTISLYYVQATVEKAPSKKNNTYSDMKCISRVPNTTIVIWNLFSGASIKELCNKFYEEEYIELEFCNIVSGVGHRMYGFIGFSTQTEATDWLEDNRGMMQLRNTPIYVAYCDKNYQPDWICKCEYVNFRKNTSCNKCAGPRPKYLKLVGYGTESTVETQLSQGTSLKTQTKEIQLPGISEAGSVPSCTLLFCGLDELTVEETLQQRVQETLGIQCRDLRIMRDPVTKKSKSYAFGEMDTILEAETLKKSKSLYVDRKNVLVYFAKETFKSILAVQMLAPAIASKTWTQNPASTTKTTTQNPVSTAKTATLNSAGKVTQNKMANTATGAKPNCMHIQKTRVQSLNTTTQQDARKVETGGKDQPKVTPSSSVEEPGSGKRIPGAKAKATTEAAGSPAKKVKVGPEGSKPKPGVEQRHEKQEGRPPLLDLLLIRYKGWLFDPYNNTFYDNSHPIKCSVPSCSNRKILLDWKSLQSHWERIHIPTIRAYLCSHVTCVSGKLFAGIQSFNNHLRSHTDINQEDYKDYLENASTRLVKNKKYSDPGDNVLPSPKQVPGPNIDLPKTKCPVKNCDQTCTTCASFKEHWNKYHSPKKIVYRCGTCDTIEQDQKSMTLHMKTHGTKVQMEKVVLDNKLFTDPDNLVPAWSLYSDTYEDSDIEDPDEDSTDPEFSEIEIPAIPDDPRDICEFLQWSKNYMDRINDIHKRAVVELQVLVKLTMMSSKKKQ